jgi:type VI secretion system secreted protein Hcp
MASDYLLEIDGIKGESSDTKHPGLIEVDSVTWGVSNPTNMAAGGGGGGGKASFSDLSFHAAVGKQSPLLMQACATGKHIAKAVLYIRKQGTDQLDFYVVTLTDLLVSSYQSGAGGSAPADSFSLNFAKIEFSYSPQKADGSLDTAVKASWDLKKNVK